MKTYHSIIVELNPGDFMFIMDIPSIRYAELNLDNSEIKQIAIYLNTMVNPGIPATPFVYCFDESSGEFQDKYLIFNPLSWDITSMTYRTKKDVCPNCLDPIERNKTAQKELERISIDKGWVKISFDKEAKDES